MSEMSKIRQILNEAGPDSKPGRMEPTGTGQDLGGPVVTPATTSGADYAKPIGYKSAALPKQGGAASEGGAPNPTKFKKEADVKAKLGKTIAETEDDIQETSELPQWLQDRLMEASLEEDEVDEEEVSEDELPEEEEEVSEDEVDESEEVAEDELPEEEVDMKEAFKISKPSLTTEDVNALFAGTKLTEKAKNQILTVFEAVVVREVNAQMEVIGEQYTQELAEEVDAMAEVLAEKVDSYLNDITESWVNDNEAAIEQGIRTQLAESLLAEMKDVFTRHYIDIPENKIDMVDTLAERVESLEAELNESLKKTAKLTEQVTRSNKEQVIRSATQGMVLVDQERVAKLAEGVEYRSEADFAEKVEIIKEHYTGKAKPGTKTVLTEEADTLNGRKSGNSYAQNAADAYNVVFKNR